MYLEHFGLKDFPFRITPDPAFLFWTADHHRAFDILTQTSRDDRPVAMLLGAPGTGKTTLLKHFVASLPKTMHVGMISTYSSGLGGLGHWLHWAFDLRAEGPEDELRAAFAAHLVAQHHKGIRCLLIVDEAQNVSDDDIAVLTDLTRLPQLSGVSMRLILAGQPRLHGHLPAADGRGEAIDSAPLLIGAMSQEDVAGYVRHRMAISGCLDSVFDAEALGRIARHSGGVPRLVNVLCELLLTSAFGADVRKLDAAFVDSVLQDVRQSGGVLRHVLGQPGRRGSRVAPTRARATSPPVPASPPPATAEKTAPPTSPLTPDAGPTTVRVMAEAVAARTPTNTSAAPNAPHDFTSTPIKALPAKFHARRAGLAVIAASAAAAAVAIAVLSSESIATAPIVATLQQDDASIAPASHPAPTLVAVSPALPAPPSFQGTDAAVLYDQALIVGAQNSLATAIGFARAALRGNARAAYYLGQLFETGDGVPTNDALAAAWYASAAETQRSARRALQSLSETAEETERRVTAPPRPLMGIAVPGGLAEFVWAAPDGGAARYLIELADTPDAPSEQHGPFDLSAALLARASPPRLWRVISIAPDGAHISASNWHTIASAH